MFRKSFLFISLLILLILPCFVLAETPLGVLEKTGKDSGFAEANELTISFIIGSVVSTALSLLGVIFIILIIYGGGRWMMSQGNEQEVDAAKKIIKNSLIGLIIVVGAYAIYNLVSFLITGERVI
jgi:hypothetical protein